MYFTPSAGFWGVDQRRRLGLLRKNRLPASDSAEGRRRSKAAARPGGATLRTRRGTGVGENWNGRIHAAAPFVAYFAVASEAQALPMSCRALRPLSLSPVSACGLR